MVLVGSLKALEHLLGGEMGVLWGAEYPKAVGFSTEASVGLYFPLRSSDSVLDSDSVSGAKWTSGGVFINEPVSAIPETEVSGAVANLSLIAGSQPWEPAWCF